MAGQRGIEVKGRYEAELLPNSMEKRSAADVLSTAWVGEADSDLAYSRITGWPSYSVTPLVELTGAAGELGLGALYCKDESRRLGLSSFKALGAIYASVTEVSKRLEAKLGKSVPDVDLLAGKYAHALSDILLICCTDGNHGFSVATAARWMGCKAVIYIPRGVSRAREEALRGEGAEVVRVDGIYDEAYATVENVAAETAGAAIISDSAKPYYTDIPALCMAGYTVMAREIVEQLGDTTFTHIMLPAGCGGMAAAMITGFYRLLGDRAPRAIIVEPNTADCVFISGLATQSSRAAGDLETLMGGLSCAEVSHVAWPTLSLGASAFLRMNDDAAVDAMRWFANPKGNDPRIEAGETGAAGLGGILAMAEDNGVRKLIGLDRSARVLVINCEGATDPEAYRKLVGHEPSLAPETVV